MNTFGNIISKLRSLSRVSPLVVDISERNAVYEKTDFDVFTAEVCRQSSGGLIDRCDQWSIMSVCDEDSVSRVTSLWDDADDEYSASIYSNCNNNNNNNRNLDLLSVDEYEQYSSFEVLPKMPEELNTVIGEVIDQHVFKNSESKKCSLKRFVKKVAKQLMSRLCM